MDFQAKPVPGSYLLNVVIPTGLSSSGNVTTGTKSRTARLNTAAPLPTWGTPPTFTPDGMGGGSIVTHFSAGPGVTEEFVELVNVGGSATPGGTTSGLACQKSGSGPYYYTFRVTPGEISVAVPDAIGAAPPGQLQPHTFCTGAENGGIGDGWLVYGVAFDYPAFESAFPQSSGLAAPPITGANGQADLTTSGASSGNVP